MRFSTDKVLEHSLGLISACLLSSKDRPTMSILVIEIIYMLLVLSFIFFFWLCSIILPDLQIVVDTVTARYNDTLSRGTKKVLVYRIIVITNGRSKLWQLDKMLSRY